MTANSVLLHKRPGRHIRICARVLALVIIVLLAATVVTAERGGALGNQRQFNTFGWIGYGGASPPGDYLVKQAEISVFLAGGASGLPDAFTTQETCMGSSGVDGQFAAMWFGMNILSDNVQGGYHYGGDWYVQVPFGAAYPRYDNDNCYQFGPTVLAYGNCQNCWWSYPVADDYDAAGSFDPGDFHRGYVCVYPSIYVFDYGVCSTHLSTGSHAGARDAQAMEFINERQAAHEYINLPAMLGGDFNGNPVLFSPVWLLTVYGGAQEADPQLENTCCFNANKFDYFIRLNWWSMVARGDPFPPACVGGIPCGNANGSHMSDHKLLPAFFA